MFQVKYMCSACNKEFDIASSLNKHIVICDKYVDWIKNYKPPLTENCISCNKNFINMNDHNCLNQNN